MATFNVTNLNDSGAGSLRQAVLNANAAGGTGHEIVFAPGLSGGTIRLTSQINITSGVTISGDLDGDRRADITISGNDANRIFFISGANADVVLRSLTLTEGLALASDGGAILTDTGTALTVIDSTIADSSATDAGGGIYSRGLLTVVNSTISGNVAGNGGGIFLSGTAAGSSLTNVTITGNEAIANNGSGGGILNAAAGLSIVNSTITGNDADRGSGIHMSAALNISNSVVAENTGGNDIGKTSDYTLTANNSFFGADPLINSGSGNIFGGDPLLGALADNGGPVLTRTPLPGSPLINAGNAALLPNDLFDLDGDGNFAEPLPVDARHGPRLTSSALDIGAAEFDMRPVITSNGGGPAAAFSLPEGDMFITVVRSADHENLQRTYSISGGADAAQFFIDPVGGGFQFLRPTDFEAPTDVGRANIYEVTVRVTNSEGLFDEQTITVTVTNLPEPPPVITSNGGEATAAISVAENGTAVTTVTASTMVSQGRTFSIAGGADAALFAIDATTGALAFLAAPDFEAPADANGDNVYDVTVSVTDTALQSDTQEITVTVTDVDEPPVITSNGGGATAAVSVAENTTPVTTVTATDPENLPRTYSISGGADAALFAVNAATGALAFLAAPDFEAPADANGDNVYEVTVRATDAGDLLDEQAITVTVTNVNERPVITSNGGGTTAAISVAENTTAVTTVTSTDPENQTRTYSISGGADAARFAIDAATGALAFITAPDFEAPTDTGANNIYDVVVRATDTGNLFDEQTIAVTVTNVDETPPGGGGTPPGGGDTPPGGGDTPPGGGDTPPGGGGTPPGDEPPPGDPGGVEPRDFSGGSFTLAATFAELAGGTFAGFSADDRIVIQGQSLTRAAFSFNAATGVMSVDLDGDGAIDGTFTFTGNFPGGDFMAVPTPAGTFLTFEPFLPALAEASAVSPQVINGIVNQEFITGDGTRGFRVALESIAGADNNNALGVYEVDAQGRIVDVRILFADTNADPTATATITGVEAGNRLGFFIVQDGADFAAVLRPADTLSFIDATGAPATVSSGGGSPRLAVNGRASGETVLHSFAAELNPNGVQHVLSGVAAGGLAMTVAFEDLTDGSDRDYQDVVFTVDWIT